MPVAIPSCFFVRLSSTAAIEGAACREDFLTECLAAALAEDPGLARTFTALMLGDAAGGEHAAEYTAPSIETQVSREGARLDLVLRRTGAPPIAVEVKLTAPEGDWQLLKYLALKERYCVALLAPGPRHVGNEVISDPRYLRPADGRDHFTWSDVYALLEGGTGSLSAATTIRTALVGLLDDLGFAPAPPQFGNLWAEDAAERARARQDAAKLLNGVREAFRALGWELQGGDMPGDVFTRHGSVGRLSRVWVGTFVDRTGMKIRLYFPSDDDRADALEALKETIAESASGAPGIAVLEQASVVPVRTVQDKDPRVACAVDVIVPYGAPDRLETASAIRARWAETVYTVVSIANSDRANSTNGPQSRAAQVSHI